VRWREIAGWKCTWQGIHRWHSRQPARSWVLAMLLATPVLLVATSGLSCWSSSHALILYSCWIDRQRLAKLEAALAHKDSEIAALRATLASRACSHWTWPGAHLPTHGADTLARSRNDEQTGAQTQKSAMRKLELELAHFRAAARRQRASDGVAAIAEAGRFAVF
jgi:hypothetical protein